MDEQWAEAAKAAFASGTVARLVFATGTSARGLCAQGLITEDELARYLRLPADDRAVWEQSDLLERQRLHLIEGGGGSVELPDDPEPDPDGSLLPGFEERAAEKQASRQRDLDRLASSEITPEQLNEENGAFARALRGAKLVPQKDRLG